jgi:hypothetical protein
MVKFYSHNQPNLDSYFNLPAILSSTPGAISLLTTRYIRLNMQFVLASLLVLVAAPVAVFACEGECIVAITNAFLGNYSTPIHNVLDIIVGHNNSAFLYSTT